MTSQHNNPTITPPLPARPYSGVLSSRLIAYLIDLLMIALFSVLLSVVILVLGVVTFGIGWALMPIVAGAGVIYSALTVGGRRSATIGMRLLGLRVITSDGRAPDMLSAAIHALLFYVAASTALLLFVDIVIGFARRDRRLGHDLVVDFVVVNDR